MKHTNKRTIVAGIVVCAVSTAASASNNTLVANDLSLSDVKFVSQQENAKSVSFEQSQDSLLLKKDITPTDGIKLARPGIKVGKNRHNPSKNIESLWDWIFG